MRTPTELMTICGRLVLCYNTQANEDKNEVAKRTEEFINQRIEKLNEELGDTEGHLESYKRPRYGRAQDQCYQCLLTG